MEAADGSIRSCLEVFVFSVFFVLCGCHPPLSIPPPPLVLCSYLQLLPPSVQLLKYQYGMMTNNQIEINTMIQ